MFRAQFPEFGPVSDSLVATMLGAATLELDTSVWGAFGSVGTNMTKADQGQMYLAAHKLAASPFGQAAKMVPNPNLSGYRRTTYGAEFMLLMRGVTSGFRVA
jgi:hypothetical protein